MERKYSNIYVDLESLFDIRQATLLSLLPSEKVTDFLFSDDYNFREVDEFLLVNKQDYDNIVNNIDKTLLANSTITYIFNVVDSKLANIERKNIFYGETTFPKLLVNVHPLNLTENEMEIFRNYIFYKLKTKCEIEIVNYSLDIITPYFIKTNNIISLFIYRFNKWLEKHLEALANIKLPDSIFYFPSLYMVKPTEEDISKLNKLNYKELFSFTELFLSSSTCVRFLPVFFYSNLIVAETILEKNKDVIRSFNLKEMEAANGHISTEV